MKLIRPVKDDGAPDPAQGRHSRTPGKPQWLKDWIADQPKYVELSCGHRDRLGIRGELIRKVFKELEMFCERCNAFARITKTISLRQYHNITAVAETTEPLF